MCDIYTQNKNLQQATKRAVNETREFSRLSVL